MGVGGSGPATPRHAQGLVVMEVITVYGIRNAGHEVAERRGKLSRRIRRWVPEGHEAKRVGSVLVGLYQQGCQPSRTDFACCATTYK